MEQSTFDALADAFGASPTKEIAKILFFHCLETNQLDRLSSYCMALENDLNEQEIRAIAIALGSDEQQSLLQACCKTAPPDITHTIVKSLIELNLYDQAKRLYCHLREHDNHLTCREIEETLDIPPKELRLKVVEKPDAPVVEDLARYRDRSTDFADVVGLEKIKKQIHKKIILPFHKPSLYQRFRKKVGGGVLLYGPPGCGKTLLARATAGECNASFFNIEVADVLDMYIGESEHKLHTLFEKARAESPSVLFFDELEALAGKREHSRNQTSANLVSQFLTELDGFSQNNSAVLVLASTNVPWAVDNAFLRPGRFDRMLFVSPPDSAAREAILRHHMKDRPAQRNIDFRLLASKTTGYSGADLANLVEMAADEAIEESIESDDDVEITQAHFKEALLEARATTAEWLTTARNYARYANDGGRYDDVIDFVKKHGK